MTQADEELDLSLVVTHLVKGVVYRDRRERVWRHLSLAEVGSQCLR